MIPKYGETPHKKNYIKLRNCYICQRRSAQNCAKCPPQAVIHDGLEIFDEFYKIISIARKELKQSGKDELNIDLTLNVKSQKKKGG